MQNPISNYNSFDDLMKATELAKDMTKKLQLMPIEGVYKSFLKLHTEGLDTSKNCEQRLVILYRAGEIANIILRRSDFKNQFKDKLIFAHKFEQCMLEIGKLKERVLLLYSEPTVNVKPTPVKPSVQPVEIKKAPEPQKNVTRSIEPKELVRSLTKDKKCAILFDYRADQTQKIITPCSPSLTVISVPRDAIVAGLTYKTLTTSLPVGQRSLLQRVFDVHINVLMEESDPPLINGKLPVDSKAAILRRAFVDYHQQAKKPPEPFILRGGFENYKLQYPTYVSSDLNNNRKDQDEMDRFLSSYKNERLNVVYPEISPIRQAQPKPPFPRVDVSTRQEPFPSHRKETTFDVSPQPPVHVDVKPAPITSPQNGIAIVNTSPILPPVDNGRPIPRMPSKQDTVQPKAMLPPHIGPSIDRTNKPGSGTAQGLGPGAELPDNRPEPPPKPEPPVAPIRPPVTTAIPPRNNFSHSSIDRSTKPLRNVMTPEHEQRCLKIYHLMIEHTRDESSRRPCMPGRTGLYNMGNTCFMNALLQALFHTPELINLFTKDKFLTAVNPQNKFGSGGVISSVFSALLDLMWSGEYSAIRPRKFLTSFAKEVNSTLADGHQHDASEFQIFLLDALHEDTNIVLERVSFEQNYKGGANILREAQDYCEKSYRFSYSPINRIFNLQMVSELECKRCRDHSVTFEDCSLITVELPHVIERHTTLNNCLARHFSESDLDDWNCPKCKSRQLARRSTKLWKLPPILVVHLKRFSIVNGDYEKNAMNVDFDPSQLSLQPYLHGSADHRQGSMYRLYAVTNHRGRLSSGHYTAMVAHAKTGEWMRMDDETVSSTSCSAIDTSDAYILFYKKVN